MTEQNIFIMVAVMAIVTALTRFLPFLVFSGKTKTPPIIDKLGRMLPFAIMGMLVVYCLKGTAFNELAGFMPSLVACIVVAVSYVYKRNTLISILCGTICYMFLVQCIF